MRTLVYLLLLLISSNIYSQSIVNNKFKFENSEIEYTSYISKKDKKQFNLVIIDTFKTQNQLNADIKKCLKKKKIFKSNYFFLAIPKIFFNQKEALVLEYITQILGSKKLIDYEMNIISDNYYFKLYEETREKNKNKYKYVFLNKINNIKTINSKKDICEIVN